MDEFVYFFEGVRRLDWGLGNPNKTAALIAEGMVAVWGLARLHRRLLVCSAVMFAGLGCCLAHTFSRGGAVACAAGLIAAMAVNPNGFRDTVRHARFYEWLAVVMAVAVVAVYATNIGATRRYVQGVAEEDRSISNRFALWRTAPEMMADAPGGWGLGRAGQAYMRWYQPVDRDERYRTLVNSHLTWMVEMGWPLRFLYVAGWLSVLLLCQSHARQKGHGEAFGIWTAFAVAAMFSSVAESPWVWFLPVAALFMVWISHAKTGSWPSIRNWVMVAGVSSVVCAGFLLAGLSGKGSIKLRAGRVILGNGAVKAWLVADEKGLGGEGFAKTLRKQVFSRGTSCRVGVIESLDRLPTDLPGCVVMVSGRPDGITSEHMRSVMETARKLILLAPAYYPLEAGLEQSGSENTEVLFGEFSQSPYFPAWEETGRVRCVAGMGDYFPDWPALLF